MQVPSRSVSHVVLVSFRFILASFSPFETSLQYVDCVRDVYSSLKKQLKVVSLALL